MLEVLLGGGGGQQQSAESKHGNPPTDARLTPCQVLRTSSFSCGLNLPVSVLLSPCRSESEKKPLGGLGGP